MNLKKKCFFCKKKVDLINFTCKCDHIFCIKCKDPEIHKCTYDYKSEFKDLLEINNPIITPSKIQSI